MKKTIYITGIAGLLGSNLVYNLKDKYIICGCDIIQVKCQDCSFDCFDLLNYELLEKNILKHKPDVIIHTAAMVNVDECEEKQELAYKMNDELTKRISKIGQENHIKILYISTDAVFDGENPGFYTEEDMPNPINIYAKTKLTGETHILNNENNIVIRTNIYGFNIQNKNSFGEWILNSLLEKKELSMFEDIYYSPILVNELATIIDKIIETNKRGLYHVCASGSISKYEFGCNLKNKFKLTNGKINKANSKNMSFKAKRPLNMGLQNQKICKELGITISSPQESINYFKKLYDEKYPEMLKRVVKI